MGLFDGLIISTTVIAVIIAAILLFLFNAFIGWFAPAIIMALGAFGLIAFYTGKIPKNFSVPTLFISAILFIGPSIAGIAFSVIPGVPFLTQDFSADITTSCSFANCYDAGNNRMEGTYASGIFSTTSITEVSLQQDYDVRAVTCQAKVTATPNCNTASGQIVSQILTKDGYWIDYYASSFSECMPESSSANQINKVWKLPGQNEYVYYNTGGPSLDLKEGQRFITDKVRCRIDYGWQTARYENRLQTQAGTLKVFGDVVTPTCSDGIKNQDETEIDCGGPCQACTTTADSCGDQVCTGLESVSSCPTDCSEIQLNEPEENIPGEAQHIEVVVTENNQEIEVVSSDIQPYNPLFVWMVGITVVVVIATVIWLIFFFKRR